MLMTDAPDVTSLQQQVQDLERQLADIHAELSKYLDMSDRETIIGGIRNLIQASILNEEAAKKAMSLWKGLNEDTCEGEGPG